MKHAKASGSEKVSGLFYVPVEGQSTRKVLRSSENGVFVGVGRACLAPFFLDPGLLINPHVFILGMSGGGKTFLMRSLLLRMHAGPGNELVVIDLTGEYGMAAGLQTDDERNALDPISYVGEDGFRIAYFCLGDLPEKEKVEAAREILGEVSARMRRRPIGQGPMMFVLLDEAWKLLREENSLRIILREGRKYRVGLMMASQMVEDMELPMLSGSGALFIFRMQNRASLDRLARNYGLGREDIETVQNLSVGSCMAIQVRGSGRREVVVLERVAGAGTVRYVGIGSGRMVVEVAEGELFRKVKGLCKDDPSGLLGEISSGMTVELHVLMARLIGLGADRRKVLAAMRELGMEDYEIADAFAAAVGGVSDGRLPG